MQLVLLLLGIMWVGAGVYYFRGRPESRSADSIGSFRHQLHVLKRTGPTAIDPAHRLADTMPFGSSVTLALAPPARRSVSPLSTSTARRRQVLRRRRDVFFGLCLAVMGSLVLGIAPGLRVMWVLALVLAVVLAGYVALLIQLRNRSAERSMKVRFLPPARPAEPALLLRRSAN